MADFRDGKVNGERFLVHPGLASQEDRTKKGRRTAVMEAMRVMEVSAGSAGYLGQDQRLLL